MQKSFLVVFDGIDGSGKTTQMLLTAKYLLELKKFDPILLTREPTFGKFGMELKRILSAGKKASKERILELYLLDREEHIEKTLAPALKKPNSIVLCSRFKYSTFAYQLAQGISEEKIVSMNKKMKKIKPDLVLVFTLNPREAIRRIDSDKARKPKTIFEKELFQEKVLQNFLKAKDFFPGEKIVFINAGKSIERVFEEVKKEIAKLI